MPPLLLMQLFLHIWDHPTLRFSGAQGLLWVSKTLGIQPEHDSHSSSPENPEPYLKMYSLFI